MQRFFGYARVITTAAPVASPTVTVYNAGTLTVSTIYDDNLSTPTPKANPFTADANGFLYFYAANGKYDVKISGGTPAISSPYTWGDVTLLDVLDDLGINRVASSNAAMHVHGASGGAHTRTVQIDMGVESGTGGVWTGLVVNTKASEDSTFNPDSSQIFGIAIDTAMTQPSTTEATVMGINVQAKLLEGASGFGEITGGEVDMISEEEPTYRCGWLISAVPSSDNPTLQNFGATGAVDCAVGIASKNFGAKFRDGIFFHAFTGTQFPIQTSGSLIRAYHDSATTIHAGLNLSDTNNISYTYPIIVPGFRIKFTAGATWQLCLGTNADPAGGSSLDLTATDGALVVNRMTTAQRDALGGPINGMIIYNTTLAKFQGYEAGAWANLI